MKKNLQKILILFFKFLKMEINIFNVLVQYVEIKKLVLLKINNIIYKNGNIRYS